MTCCCRKLLQQRGNVLYRNMYPYPAVRVCFCALLSISPVGIGGVELCSLHSADWLTCSPTEIGVEVTIMRTAVLYFGELRASCWKAIFGGSYFGFGLLLFFFFTKYLLLLLLFLLYFAHVYFWHCFDRCGHMFYFTVTINYCRYFCGGHNAPPCHKHRWW